MSFLSYHSSGKAAAEPMQAADQEYEYIDHHVVVSQRSSKSNEADLLKVGLIAVASVTRHVTAVT